jgi:hypothetical protein
MYQSPFPLLCNPLPGRLLSAGRAVYPSSHDNARPTLNAYLDAYQFHRRVCEQISLGREINLDELLPKLANDDDAYLENFSAFVIAHTLPAIRQIFYESGHSNRERRALLDALLRKLRRPSKVLAEQQAQKQRI